MEILHSTGHERLDRIRAAMTRPADLDFGQTPWDGLGREDLVFLLQSLHAAAAGAHAVLRRCAYPGDPEAERELARLQAAVTHVYADHLGPIDVHGAFGREEVRDGQSEEDLLSRFMTGPTRDLLAFDAPSRRYWACPTGQFIISSMGENPPTCTCARLRDAPPEGTPCGLRTASWDDWRASRAPAPPEGP